MLVPEIPDNLLQQKDVQTVEDSYTVDQDRLDLIPEYKDYSFYAECIEEEKPYTKFIKQIERLARTSNEMRKLIKYLNEELDMDKCAILSGVNSGNAKIEVHHYPFTLYDLCDIIIQNRLSMNKSFSTVDVAQELVEIHYLKLVGLVPLSKSVHELAHNGKIFINLRHVFGDIKTFIQKYKYGLNDEYIERLKHLIHLSSIESSETLNQNTLRVSRKIWMDAELNMGELLDEGVNPDELRFLLGMSSGSDEETDNRVEED